MWTSQKNRNKIRFFSELVVVKRGKKVGYLSKQNGHPVSPKSIWFKCKEKPYTKEACDVRTYYSILFPLSSNQNCRSIGFTRRRRISYSGSTQQTLSPHLSWLRSKSLRCTQLGRTHSAGSEYGHGPRVDQVPVPQAVLSAMSGHPYRGLGTFSSVSASNPPDGPLCISAMSHVDRIGCSPASGTELENSQRHRQILSGARLRPTGLKRLAYLSRRRNLHPQRPSLSNGGNGLSQWPGGLCRQRSQGQNAETFLQSVQR